MINKSVRKQPGYINLHGDTEVINYLQWGSKDVMSPVACFYSF